MKTWRERLQEALDEKGLSRSDLAAYVGIAPASVTDWFNGKTKKMVAENAFLAAKAVGVHLEWLLFGTGPRRRGDAPVENDAVIAITARALPLSATIHGEHIHEGEDEAKEPLYFQASWIKKMGYKPEHLVARQVLGSSMEPALKDGDTVLINCASRKPLHGRTFWITVEGEACVKRLRKVQGYWWVTSDNPTHTVRDIELQSHEDIMGEVILKSSTHI